MILQKQTTTLGELEVNERGDACAMCGQHKANIPISDDENEYWICVICNQQIKWEDEKVEVALEEQKLLRRA